jgi:RimJ/RimL family protein N-acetyltransferase/Ser/Thr protein kinase RdoA (MazF antagonist)
LDIGLIQTVLSHWELKNPFTEKCLKEDSLRPVYRIRTDAGRFILKGYSEKTPEETIKSNILAHLFLGNEKGFAPKIFPTTAGDYYVCCQGYWFYLMEFIDGRQFRETPEDEFLLGQTVRKMHALQGYGVKSHFTQSKLEYYKWFRDRSFVREFDAILDGIPDFEKLDQCFVHTDLGPHNTMLDQNGRVVLVDLDDSGIGSRFLDLGWPFIMQFVDFNHDTEEMQYRFDLAESFLRGYYGENGIPREEFDLIFHGAEQMHISYMQTYGPYAVDSLWKILIFGRDQKEKLWNRIHDTKEILFKTEHLIVRKFRPDDAKRLYEYHLDENVKQWMPNESYADVAEAEDAISFFIDCVENDHLPYVLAVELKRNGELIGDTGINEVEGKQGEIEIGYVISDRYCGNGYATELVNAMTAFAILKFGMKVLYGRVMHGNKASARVLEKNGYSFSEEEFEAEDDPYGNGMLVYVYVGD